MDYSLPLDQMSKSEMLVAMEQLWEALRRSPEDVVSPDWHGTVLADREQAIAEGKASFTDFEEAKGRIRKAT